ncbi:MAG: type II toxin-antitoxin system RelE/ParE family toxin [Anaerolineales bacterium]|nr:type II toxin-antitoxin system RelE/ParE family toxin [Anaerolineales bacterium]
MYQIINASRRVERELDKIPARDFERVVEAIQHLAENPRPFGVVKLAASIHRIRVGRYRVIYAIDDAAKVVIITKVKKRSEGTYKSFD